MTSIAVRDGWRHTKVKYLYMSIGVWRSCTSFDVLKWGWAAMSYNAFDLAGVFSHTWFEAVHKRLWLTDIWVHRCNHWKQKTRSHSPCQLIGLAIQMSTAAFVLAVWWYPWHKSRLKLYLKVFMIRRDYLYDMDWYSWGSRHLLTPRNSYRKRYNCYSPDLGRVASSHIWCHDEQAIRRAELTEHRDKISSLHSVQNSYNVWLICWKCHVSNA